MWDRRQAIVEAAAAEIALAEAVGVRLGDVPRPAQEEIVHDADGIVGLVELVEALDGVAGEASRLGRVRGRVAGPRNRAAHRGEEPTWPELHSALEVIRELLVAYTPVPDPIPPQVG